jgi:ferritin
MISEKIRDAFNEQIKNELYSAYLYLSMAAYFHSLGLNGMARWMKVQATEEIEHAQKFFDHIIEREGRVRLLALEQPRPEWSSPLDAWQNAHKHEQSVTSMINSLVKLAQEEKDNAAMPLLNWFVKEQIEEEASPLKIVQTLTRIGDSRSDLDRVDRELGERE